MNSRIYKHLKTVKQKLNRSAINFYQGNSASSTSSTETTGNYEDYKSFIDSNSCASLNYVEKITVKDLSYRANWVGGVRWGDIVFGIPNSADSVITYNTKNGKTTFLGDLGNESYKWTCGYLYNKKIYCFPRSSNSLLEIDPQKMTVSLKQLKTDYQKQHHYAGVVTADGKMYLPPRDSNHILSIDLNTHAINKIYLCPPNLKLNFRYQNGILHHNEMIYFFPERNEKVLVFNPKTKTHHYIGNNLNCYVFEAQICLDNNIYGFSHKKGILKIDVKNQSTEMLHNNIFFGSYGTKHGVNGKLYSVPGESQKIYEYDVKQDKITEVFYIQEQGPAKCAGGVTLDDGSIVTIPAYGNYFYRYRFNNVRNKLSTELRDSLFYSNTY